MKASYKIKLLLIFMQNFQHSVEKIKQGCNTLNSNYDYYAIIIQWEFHCLGDTVRLSFPPKVFSRTKQSGGLRKTAFAHFRA
jgi:hypothetical protein